MKAPPCPRCDGRVGLVTPGLCYKCGRSPYSRPASALPFASPEPPPPLEFTDAFLMDDDARQLTLCQESDAVEHAPTKAPRKYRNRYLKPEQTAQGRLF